MSPQGGETQTNAVGGNSEAVNYGGSSDVLDKKIDNLSNQMDKIGKANTPDNVESTKYSAVSGNPEILSSIKEGDANATDAKSQAITENGSLKDNYSEKSPDWKKRK